MTLTQNLTNLQSQVERSNKTTFEQVAQDLQALNDDIISSWFENANDFVLWEEVTDLFEQKAKNLNKLNAIEQNLYTQKYKIQAKALEDGINEELIDNNPDDTNGREATTYREVMFEQAEDQVIWEGETLTSDTLRELLGNNQGKNLEQLSVDNPDLAYVLSSMFYLHNMNFKAVSYILESSKEDNDQTATNSKINMTTLSNNIDNFMPTGVDDFDDKYDAIADQDDSPFGAMDGVLKNFMFGWETNTSTLATSLKNDLLAETITDYNDASELEEFAEKINENPDLSGEKMDEYIQDKKGVLGNFRDGLQEKWSKRVNIVRQHPWVSWWVVIWGFFGIRALVNKFRSNGAESSQETTAAQTSNKEDSWRWKGWGKKLLWWWLALAWWVYLLNKHKQNESETPEVA